MIMILMINDYFLSMIELKDYSNGFLVGFPVAWQGKKLCTPEDSRQSNRSQRNQS